MAKPSPISFDDMIKADRKKKQREELAQTLLGSKRSGGAGLRSSNSSSSTPSLASRVGVTKRSSSAQPKLNVDGRWGHDLHHVNNPSSHRSTTPRTRAPLGPRTVSNLERNLKQVDQDLSTSFSNQANIKTRASMSIRGMARTGPYVVVASNFAPGTSAADIEAAMGPVGGEIQSCNLISSSPTVMCELLFTDKDGADNVVNTFNNQKADGRLLYVYHKQGGPTPQLHPLQTAATRATKSESPPSMSTDLPIDPPKGPRDDKPRQAPPSNPREDRDSMDVDETPRAPSRDQRYDDRDLRDRDRYRDSGRGNNNNNGGYVDARYGSRDRDPHDRWGPRRDWGPSRGPRGMYSDVLYQNRRYRP